MSADERAPTRRGDDTDSCGRSLTPLGEILDKLFREGALPFNRDDLRIWEVWGDAVGPLVAENARPCWIRKGVLRVTVTDSIWLQELKYQEEIIRQQLNGILGRLAVSKIEFRMVTR